MSRRYLTKTVLAELEAKLTERDYAVLRSVSDLRFASGQQLACLHFAGEGNHASRARASRRALLRLAHLDFLTRLPRRVGGVRAGSAGFVYRLGPAGQHLAMRSGWQPQRRARRSPVPGTLFLAHCLDVAELHVLVIEADRSGRLELLELTAEPACHRTYTGLGSQRVLKPDSYLRYGLGEYEYVFFIEVDRGTEGSRAITAKLREYLAYAASGTEQAEHGVFPKVLWTVPDEARAAVIEDCTDQLPASDRELFAVALFTQVIEALATPGTSRRKLEAGLFLQVQ